jgi:L-ribulose-5-phosphate 3-epimerase UlaE
MTLNEILNSDFMNTLIEEQDKALAEAGWTMEEIREVAKMVTK